MARFLRPMGVVGNDYLFSGLRHPSTTGQGAFRCAPCAGIRAAGGRRPAVAAQGAQPARPVPVAPPPQSLADSRRWAAAGWQAFVVGQAGASKPLGSRPRLGISWGHGREGAGLLPRGRSRVVRSRQGRFGHRSMAPRRAG